MSNLEITPQMVLAEMNRQCLLAGGRLDHAYDVMNHRRIYRYNVPNSTAFVTWRVDMEDHKLSLDDFHRLHIAPAVTEVFALLLQPAP